MRAVAIVGAGPKGLYALERLIAHGGQRTGALSVTLFDPRPPGTGAAYAREQPDHLRLNVRSSAVDAGVRTGWAPTGDWLASFDDWRRAQGESDPLDEFPPRALAGRYLRHLSDELCARAPASWRLRHEPRSVSAVTRSGAHWLVDGEPFDEVLLATGHAPDHDAALRHEPTAGRLVPAVFPTDRWLGEDAVPAAATVRIRGSALTFIDAALALTEGRGGEFLPRGGEPPRYRPSGHEPRTIAPASRRGLFMDAKPAPEVVERLDLPARAVPADDTVSALLAAVRATASAYLRRGREAWDAAPGAPDADVAAALDPAARFGDPVVLLARSVAIGSGRRVPDAHWAVGQAWRDCYPDLVRALGGRTGQVAGWDDFAALAGHLERAAFGPPLVNALKLLGLLQAGILDASLLRSHGQERPGDDVVVDAVLPPPGLAGRDPLLDGLARAGTIVRAPGRRGVLVAEDLTVLDGSGGRVHGLACVGRATEDVVVGNDTLVRRLHDGPDRWAERAVRRLLPSDADARGVHGVTPLTARLEPWASALLADADACLGLLAEHGSPVNVIDPAPLLRNAAELTDAARAAGLAARVMVARKANKALCIVDAARDGGHGVDVASFAELDQALGRGVDPDVVIVTAAVKPPALLRLALEHGATVSLDNATELDGVLAAADVVGRRPRIALRVAPEPERGLPSTRFGLRADDWLALPGLEDARLDVRGVHFHLHGYAAAERVAALADALRLVDALHARGRRPRWVDIGGGVPMSYLDDAAQWDEFWAQHRAALRGEREPLTWRGHALGLRVVDGVVEGAPNVYPYHQAPVRGAWLAELLASPVPGGSTAADELGRRGLELRLEPGRALLDGCGLTLAEVAFTKRTNDGVHLVGLAMNRTQCRSTSDDFLVDPVLVRRRPASDPVEGYLVGAYCIENELILQRRLMFPRGVAAGDVIALPNTGGYLMHILESASHQIPLARNVVHAQGSFSLDPIDRR